MKRVLCAAAAVTGMAALGSAAVESEGAAQRAIRSDAAPERIAETTGRAPERDILRAAAETREDKGAAILPAKRAEEPVQKTHMGGLRPPTAEEQKWADDNLIVTRAAILNDLGLERANRERAGKGLPPLAARRLAAGDVSREEEMEAHIDEARALSASLAKGSILVARQGCEALGFTAGREDLSGDSPADGPSDFGENFLPSVVDNSVLPSFPPIRSQGAQGSCASFSTTYYMLTHMIGLARGWDAKNDPTDTHKFSPRWTYNLLNGGSYGGTDLYAPLSLLKTAGCGLWADFPYSGLLYPATEYTAWCADPQVWRDALSFRWRQAGAIDQNHDPDFTLLKTLLADGYVLVGARSGGVTHVAAKDNPASAADDALVGEPLFACLTSQPVHAQTIVGYNDHVWCDLNDNDGIDAGELGAFKVADSDFSGTGGCGYQWFAYDALRKQTAVSGWTPCPGRGPAFDQKLWLNAYTSCEPRFVAEFSVKHAKRNQVNVRVGASLPTGSSPTATGFVSALCHNGGALGFDGLDYSSNPSAAPAFTFCADFGGMFTNLPTRWYIGLQDDTGDGFAGGMMSAEIVDRATGAARHLLPASVTANGSTAWTMTDYQGPAHVITATAGNNGSIFPSGAVTAIRGLDYAFTVVGAYAAVADVKVDGVSLGPASSYTFADVSGDHTIHATFARRDTYVSPSGGDTPPYDTWATAARSLQDAVDACTEPSYITVADGVYRMPWLEVDHRDVYIKSVNGPANTVLESDGGSPWELVFIFNDVLDGFTVRGSSREGILCEECEIRNCVIEGNGGAGAYISYGTMQDCVARDNAGRGVEASMDAGAGFLGNCLIAGNAGGGVYIDGGGSIENCTIIGNSAAEGGGICWTGNELAVLNCLIAGNTSSQNGGGLYCPNDGSTTLRNCTIAGNSAGSAGGGAYVEPQGRIRALNCIAWGNSAPQRPDIAANPYPYFSQMHHSCTSSPLSGAGNISADPLFLDPAGGDWRLRADSPCVDAGNTGYASGTDLDGGARVHGAAVDMGAYEVGAPAVAAPAAGAMWVKGSTRTIRWRNLPGAAVRVELWKGGAISGVVAASTANDGSLPWDIPTTLQAGAGYAIRVFAPLKQIPGAQAFSPPFAICDPPVPAETGATER